MFQTVKDLIREATGSDLRLNQSVRKLNLKSIIFRHEGIKTGFVKRLQ